MSALHAHYVETDHALIRVNASQGKVRIRATITGDRATGARTLILPALVPEQGMLLARTLMEASQQALQPSLPLRSKATTTERRRLSATDLAEMRRLRAAGESLRNIAARFSCSVSTVAYQTPGLGRTSTPSMQRPPETVEAIVRLFGEGCSVREIAEYMRYSESGVRAVLRRHEMHTRQQHTGPVHQLLLPLRPLVVQLPPPFRPSPAPKEWIT